MTNSPRRRPGIRSLTAMIVAIVACAAAVVAFRASEPSSAVAAATGSTTPSPALGAATAPLAANPRKSHENGVSDRPLADWLPRSSTELVGQPTRVGTPAGGTPGLFWRARQPQRPALLLAPNAAERAADWQDFVGAVGAVMDVHALAWDAPGLRGRRGAGDLQAAVAAIRGLAPQATVLVVVALGRGMERTLLQLHGRVGLVVVAVSPTIREGGAVTRWAGDRLPWSLFVVAARGDTAATAALTGPRPRTLLYGERVVDGAGRGLELLRQGAALAAVRGWLFGVLGGHG